MQPPPWPEVPALVADWVTDVSDLGPELSADSIQMHTVPVALAELHSRFERIHPFLDGNGRAGRLTLNLILVRLGFPPAIICKRQRKAYIDALDRADKADPGPLAELIALTIIDNLHRFVVPNIAGPARLVPLSSLGTDDLSYEAVRQPPGEVVSRPSRAPMASGAAAERGSRLTPRAVSNWNGEAARWLREDELLEYWVPMTVVNTSLGASDGTRLIEVSFSRREEAERVRRRIGIDGTAPTHRRKADRTEPLRPLLRARAVIEAEVRADLLGISGIRPAKWC
jgi:hypothetical protein